MGVVTLFIDIDICKTIYTPIVQVLMMVNGSCQVTCSEEKFYAFPQPGLGLIKGHIAGFGADPKDILEALKGTVPFHVGLARTLNMRWVVVFKLSMEQPWVVGRLPWKTLISY